MRPTLLALPICFGLLAGCGPKPPLDPLPVLAPTANPNAADAALEANQIRRQYDDCIKRLGSKAPACQDLEWTYQDAKSRYDAAAAGKARQ